jgi:hypothetical protein
MGFRCWLSSKQNSTQLGEAQPQRRCGLHFKRCKGTMPPYVRLSKPIVRAGGEELPRRLTRVLIWHWYETGSDGEAVGPIS